jgi:upstream activation factor subunit UAF30
MAARNTPSKSGNKKRNNVVEYETSRNDDVAAPPQQEESVVDNPSATDASVSQQEPDVMTQLNDMSSKIAQVMSVLKVMQGQVKSAQKNVLKLQKENARKKSSKKKSGGNENGDDAGTRKPSGFDKPTLLSNTLCEFLELPSDSRMGRTDVTRRLTAYIKEHDLQDKKDKRQIWPDDRLRSILSISGDDVLTFFNIQKYIKHNFIKDT